MPASDAYDAAEIKKQKNKRNHKKTLNAHGRRKPLRSFFYAKTEKKKKKRTANTVQAAQLPYTAFAPPEIA